jgi:FkbM family methyltransferase
VGTAIIKSLDDMSVKVSLARFVQFVTLVFAKFRFVKKNRLNLIRLGSNYGGYWVPSEVEDILPPKTLISLGLGFDISLDIELLKRDFKILGFEPSYNSRNYINSFLESTGIGKQFIVVDGAISNTTGMSSFTRPKLKSNYEWWAAEMSQNAELAVVKTIKLSSLPELYPEYFESHFRMLKMDIEGSEIQVLQDFLASDLEFEYLAVEMDCLSLVSVLDIRLRARRILESRKIFSGLRRKGYTMIHNEGFNFFWVLDRYLEQHKLS